MHYESARAVLAALENHATGSPGRLPSNQALRDAVRLLLSVEDPPSPEGARLQAVIEAPTLRIDSDFVRDLQQLAARIEARADQDPALRRRLTFRPNSIPAEERSGSLFLAFAIAGYALWSLWRDDFVVLLKRRLAVHLHGFAAWTMAAAGVCAVVMLASVVVDHYDRRDNEVRYRQFAHGCRVLGWTLFSVAIAADLLLPVLVSALRGMGVL